MSIILWTGTAPAVTQVTTVTIGTYDATTTYNITIGGLSVGILGTGGTATTTAAALLALLQASAYPQFTEMTWSSSGAVITATANTAGYPFTITTAVSGGTGAISNSTTTAATGPNFGDNVLNWSTGAVPTTDDTVYLQRSSVSLLYNIGSLGAVTNLFIDSSFTGQIGLPDWNANGYYEYRAKYAVWPFAACTIGTLPGIGANFNGSSFIRLDNSTAGGSLVVLSTGQPLSGNPYALFVTGDVTTYQVTNGKVGICYFPGDTGTTTAVNIVGAGSSTVYVGQGCTLDYFRVEQPGASLTVNTGCSGSTSSSLISGNATVGGTGDHSNGIVVQSGSLVVNTTGTVSKSGGSGIVVNGAGTIDLSQNLSPKAITNIALNGVGATINDPVGLWVGQGSNTLAIGAGVTWQQVNVISEPGLSLTV